MDEQSVLIAQIDELQGRLKQIRRALTGSPGVEASLLKLVRVRFGGRLLGLEQRLENTRKRALRRRELAGCWDNFRPIRNDCQAILAESLAIFEGVLARAAGLDDGFCEWADRLVAEMHEFAAIDWNALTILDEGEQYTRLVDVIRIRFPSAGIWDLPVVAHECGHFISRRIWEDDRIGIAHDAFEEFLVANKAEPESSIRSHIHEYFADAFATYAVGPAYALTALLLRFDPSRPDDASETHPSPRTRAHLILQMLQSMDGFELAGVIELMREIWAPPDSETRFRLEGYLGGIRPIIERTFPLLRYDRWTAARVLASNLNTGPQPAHSYTLRDVLNAAWFARLDQPERLKELERAAAKWLNAPAARAAGA